MNRVDLRYRISYDEAYEAFKAVASRRSNTARTAVTAVLAAITCVLLVLFARESAAVHYLFLAVCSILLMFYLIYQPVISARRGASQVSKTAGEYHVVLHDNATMDLPDESDIDLRADKFARIVETENVFAIRPDTQHTVCIPKRILKDNEKDFIKKLASTHTA